MAAASVTSFADLSLSPDLISVTQELGFTAPTPIQAQAIPLLLAGKDVIAQSETGSGKTAAFTLPILERIDVSERRIQAIILCPTRELCAQVARDARELGRKQAGLQVLILSGGAPMGPQLGALEKGVHWIVGTPGRVVDHLQRRSLSLGDVRTVVLDEADRMLEMGFQVDMEKILKQIPRERQTVLFSATFPKTIEALSKNFQRRPERITVERKNQTVASIRQVLYEVPNEDRIKALLWILEQKKPESAIVFCNYKASVASVAQALARAGLSAGALHGDLEQNERDRIMAKFRNRSTRILIATDVAARGIDVDDLEAVVNYEIPLQPDVYVHRVGRTGRAGKKGFAVSFASSKEKAKIKTIEEYAGVSFDRKTVADLSSLDVQSLADRVQGDAPMRTLYIAGGREEKMRPGDLLGALTGEAGGLRAEDVGKIEIHDHFSYVAIATRVAETALKRLREGRIKGRKFRIEMVE